MPLKIKFILFLLLASILSCTCCSCFATSNSYTARTLEKKQTVFSPGLDYIATYHEDKITLSKEPPFVPALGVHYGLTNHLETGLRGFFPFTLEVVNRYQLTPKDFRYFDLSANLHFGCYKIKYYPYIKSGLLIGRKWKIIEPFLGYYWYYPFDREYTNARVINFGFGFPWKGATVIPEINWQFRESDIRQGVGFFSIGFRVPK
jgi:hypothetical protein